MSDSKGNNFNGITSFSLSDSYCIPNIYNRASIYTRVYCHVVVNVDWQLSLGTIAAASEVFEPRGLWQWQPFVDFCCGFFSLVGSEWKIKSQNGGARLKPFRYITFFLLFVSTNSNLHASGERNARNWIFGYFCQPTTGHGMTTSNIPEMIFSMNLQLGSDSADSVSRTSSRGIPICSEDTKELIVFPDFLHVSCPPSPLAPPVSTSLNPHLAEHSLSGSYQHQKNLAKLESVFV